MRTQPGRLVIDSGLIIHGQRLLSVSNPSCHLPWSSLADHIRQEPVLLPGVRLCEDVEILAAVFKFCPESGDCDGEHSHAQAPNGQERATPHLQLMELVKSTEARMDLH